MTVSDLCRRAGLTAAVLPEGEREVIGVYIGDLLSWVMGRAQSGDAWITIMSNQNIVAVATLADTACVILAEGVQPDKGVAQLAADKGINVLLSPDSAYDTVLRLRDCL